MVTMVKEAPRLTLEDLHSLVAMTDRVAKRRQAFLDAKPQIAAERSVLLTQSWQETEGRPLVNRRAQAFKAILEGIPVVIREGEIVVGSQTKYIRGCYPCLEVVGDKVYDELSGEMLTTGSVNVVSIADADDIRRNRECAAYWKDKCTNALVAEVHRSMWGDLPEQFTTARLTSNNRATVPSARSCDWSIVLTRGLAGVIEDARSEIAGLKGSNQEEIEKLHFLQAASISCQAVITWAHRHAEEARRLATREPDAIRRQELERIADICAWVPEHPARSFQEALQSFWFALLASKLETAGNNETPGRFDQYMYPFYEQDLSEGHITRQDAIELLGCMWTKFVELNSYKDPHQRESTQGSEFMNCTLGGVKEDGSDASNEITLMVLETERQLRYHQPHISLRYHDGISEDVLIQSVECNKAVGGGIPAFFNDKVSLISLAEKGIPLKDVRNWVPEGCVERFIMGKAMGVGSNVDLNLTKCLELALNNGVDPHTGLKVGVATEDPRSFVTYGDLVEAVKQQYKHVIDLSISMRNAYIVTRFTTYAMPFNSALIYDCIKRGKDAFAGGVRYPSLQSRVLVFGHQNTANSLTAIKKLVYEDKSVKLDELLTALKVNFEGYEELQRKLLLAPKYGNDDDYADAQMVDLFRWTEEIIKAPEHKDPWGATWSITRQGNSLHYYFGPYVGALPDGRKAWELLADGALSPMRGTDTHGPTAVVNSALKPDCLGSEATLFNMKFHVATLEGRQSVRKLWALIKSYFDRLGYMLQLNIVDPQVLLDAKKHPEKYRDLVVRVAGYSAYFVELAPEIQDEIIARTVHTMA